MLLISIITAGVLGALLARAMIRAGQAKERIRKGEDHYE